MGMIASYKMVEREIIDHLLQLDDDDLTEALDEITEDSGHKTIQIDRCWDGLHFLLTGKSVVVPMKENRLSDAIIGVHLFNEEDKNDFITFLKNEEIEAIIEAMEKLKKSELQQRFSPELFSKSKIYPDIWLTKKKDELFIWLYETGFKPLLKFYRDAFKKNKCVIIIIR